MPFGIHKQSNRSKQTLIDTSVSPSPSEIHSAAPSFASVENDRSDRVTLQSFLEASRIEPQPYDPRDSNIDSSRTPPLAPFQTASRSTSNRFSYSYPQPLPGSPARAAGGSVDDLVLETQRLQQQGRRATGQPPEQRSEKKRSIFSNLMRGSGSSRTSEQLSTPPYNNSSVGRRLSKRQEHPPVIRTDQGREELDLQRLDWQSGQASLSRSTLPSPRESPDDDGLDPYLITEPEEDTSPDSAVQGIGQPVGHQQRQTIRPVVHSDSDSPYSAEPSSSESPQDYRQYSSRQQYSPEEGYNHSSPESSSQIYYQSSVNSQQALNNLPESPEDQIAQRSPESIQPPHDFPADYRDDHHRPGSVQSNGPSPTGTYSSLRAEYPTRTTSIAPAATRPVSQQTAMAPLPTGASQQNRRSADSKQTLQMQAASDARDGPPPGYRQQQFPGNQPTAPGLSPLPAPVGNQGPNYRGGPPQREQYNAPGTGEQGRSTPPPAPAERDVNDAYKELLQKYKKVKGLYFDKTAQVEQLQNTLANQRLSQSRTSLDDNEYMTRFQRLDGAITNLAFNIRKDWRTIPLWLSQSINQDAMKIGKQEMTAVGRACITKFLVDEIFNRTFHPGLETEMSVNLKGIEQNIRLFSPAIGSQEESDALTAKVVQWRLATIDGLREVLSSPESEEYKRQFSRMATTNLTASLINFLGEPVPPGIEEFAVTIVELAVSIAANLPLESRDISIVYPMPGDMLQPVIMKTEAGIPPLEYSNAETSDIDASSTGSADKDDSPKDDKSHGKLTKEKTKSPGMLQAMMGGGGPPSKKPSVSSQGGGQEAQNGPVEVKAKNEDGAQKVRLAGFVGVEVRGRQVLGKAPVWTLA